jgi:hypothetical protein
MITELLGLAGSGLIGSMFGIVSDVIQRKQERALEKTKFKSMQEARLHGQKLKHVEAIAHVPAFTNSFFVVVATYCACCLLCILYPDAPILTFNPDDTPKRFDFLWGIFSVEWNSSKVYTISTGGIGYALLHPLSFFIGSVLTGIKASK